MRAVQHKHHVYIINETKANVVFTRSLLTILNDFFLFFFFLLLAVINMFVIGPTVASIFFFCFYNRSLRWEINQESDGFFQWQ